MEEYRFKVVPLCEKQKRDIKEKNILNGGLYRKCDVYKGGGGYDKFPAICEKRLGYNYFNQFVVQLYGCPLRCPYCYVTQDGIFGEYEEINSSEILKAFEDSGLDIFHLMGGAPALYIDGWKTIINELPGNKVFHSDFLLIESEYSEEVLNEINKKNTLFAVSIKGLGEEFKKNTGVSLNENLFWNNLNKIIKCKVNFYFTFTGLSEESVNKFKNECRNKITNFDESIFEDSFIINIVQYEALKDLNK